MINKKKILLFGVCIVTVLNLTVGNILAQNAVSSTKPATNVVAKEKSQPPATDVNFKTIDPVKLVETPQVYLNTKVKMRATFERFSTLGLDYKPAFRDSKKYISFLIRRTDVTDHSIPLSELKLIIAREKAEKLIDLESGDKIEITGEVFSTALNDPWVEVESIKIISPKVKNVSDKKDDNKKINETK